MSGRADQATVAARVERTLRRVRRAGARGLVDVAAARLASESRYLGLRCPLDDLPPLRPAAFPLLVEPVDARAFDGFRASPGEAVPVDNYELGVRQRLCDAGVRTLYVASSPERGVVYVQWCVDAAGQDAIHGVLPDHFRRLRPGEVLLEAAYAFPAARRSGAMGYAMGVLLRFARDAGARTAYTYVGADNVASLRGCAHVGFVPDHERLERWRLGRWQAAFEPLSPQGQDAWSAATAPRADGSAA